MKLTIAKSAGYCFGVKRAVNMVYQEAEEAKVPVYTYGPIIHNEEVVRDLKQRGVHVVRELKELENLPKGKIIIRSHGISRREHEEIRRKKNIPKQARNFQNKGQVASSTSNPHAFIASCSLRLIPCERMIIFPFGRFSSSLSSLTT